jgi:hypothetical protein
MIPTAWKVYFKIDVLYLVGIGVVFTFLPGIVSKVSVTRKLD